MTSKVPSRVKAAPLLLAELCLFALASCSSNSSTTTTTTPAVNNSVAVTAGFGPLGQAGGVPNGLFVNITVCQHGTQNCATIDNVLVDTGSIGLRLIPSAIGSVLSPISENGNALEECIQYGDTSYSWGPMALADVAIGGETASDVPVQLLGQTTFAVPSTCLTTPVLAGTPGTPPGNEDTLQTLGANGILGIGNGAVDGPWDCGSYCTSNIAGNPYYICPGGVCEEAEVSTGVQAENPVAAFTSSDRNGVMITLPSFGTTGAVSVSGTMSFGINTQSDNAIGSATVYSSDQCGFIPEVVYAGLPYQDTICSEEGESMGGFMDTGSNALYVSDASTLSTLGLPISDCASGTSGYGFYCVTGGGTTILSNITLVGNSGTSGLVSLNIEDATTLFNTFNGVLNDLGGDSGEGYATGTDSFDFGLPFFLGRTVFIGITGVTGETTGAFAITAPNGFVAF